MKPVYLIRSDAIQTTNSRKSRIIVLLTFILALGALNPIYGTIGISLFECLYLGMLSKMKVGIPSSFSFLWLLLFGVTYVIFGQLTLSYVEYYLVATLSAFLAGHYCSGIINNDVEKSTKALIYTIVFAEATHALLNTIVNVGTVRWRLVDFFRGYRSATGSAFINTFVFSLAFVFVFIEQRRLIRIIGITCVTISFIYSFILGTRTTYIVTAVVLTINVLLFFRERLEFRQYVKVINGLLIFALLAFIIYHRDLFRVRAMMERSNLFIRFTEIGLIKSDQFRMESVGKGIQSLLEHPFGGQIERRYFHNMWLDAGRIGGVFPFVFLIMYSINTLFHVIYLFRKKALDITYRYTVLSIYTGIMLNCFTEPVLEGIMESFLVFVFINGLVDTDYKKLKRRLSGN